MRQTRVLHLVEYLYLGGIERLLQQLALHCQEMASPHFFSYETSELNGIGKEIKALGLPVTVTKKKAPRDWQLVSTLLQYIKREQIDVIHTHDFGPMEYAVILKILRPSLRLVHTQHTLHHFVSNKKYVIAFQVAALFYDSLICVSNHVRETLLSHFNLINKRKLVTISNGVNTDFYAPSSKKQSLPDKLRLVSVSRISKEKNLEYLLETCGFLKKSAIPFEFHHAGTTEEVSKIEEINKIIEDLNIKEEVIMHGFCHDTHKILEMGDIFLSASHTEGHPVALLEAMSNERICLVSDIPAHREVSERNLTFFNKDEPLALFNKLKEISGELPAQQLVRKEQAKLCRQTVLEKFSIQKMVANYAKQYN